MSAFDQTIRSFIEEAGSSSPTPGGGSIAALSAALGASMGSMVGSLTRGSKYEDVHEEMLIIIEEMKSAINDFEGILLQDKESFHEYMVALGLPKTSNEEKLTRSNLLKKAAKRSADVPLKLMKRSYEIMNNLEKIVDKINKNVVSDLGIAIIMLEAAIQSAWITVEINLKGMKDESLEQYYQEEGTTLVNHAQHIKMNVSRRVREIIYNSN